MWDFCYSTFFDVIWEIIYWLCINRMIFLEHIIVVFKLMVSVVSTTDWVPRRVSLKDNGK